MLYQFCEKQSTFGLKFFNGLTPFYTFIRGFNFEFKLSDLGTGKLRAARFLPPRHQGTKVTVKRILSPNPSLIYASGGQGTLFVKTAPCALAEGA